LFGAEARRLGGAGSAALPTISLLEDVVMRTHDFAPLFRSTIGFDRLFDKLEEASGRTEWPPYRIERTDENQYRISMAVAGFDRSDIEVVQQGNALLVTGEKKPAEQSQRDMLHQGLAFRNFRQTFNCADHVKVSAATIENGLLSIELVRQVPEALKPRRIEIGAPSRTISAQDNSVKLSDQNAERQPRAAKVWDSTLALSLPALLVGLIAEIGDVTSHKNRPFGYRDLRSCRRSLARLEGALRISDAI
jgi:molecular chaperone IbpA